MSKELKKYVKDCVRTEAPVEKIEVNSYLLANLFNSYIQMTEILDAVKKSVFYGKDQKLLSETQSRLAAIQYNIEKLSTINTQVQDFFTENKKTIKVDPRLFHAILGIATESGELVEILWNAIQLNKPVDPVHVQEEFGDLNWYQGLAHDDLKLDFSETLDKNIRKLQVRYPEKFTQKKAEVRDLKAEREQLEKNKG